MRYTDDPPADWDAYCREQDKYMEQMPYCDECGQRIEDEFCYKIGDYIMCEECIDRCRKYTTDLIDY